MGLFGGNKSNVISTTGAALEGHHPSGIITTTGNNKTDCINPLDKLALERGGVGICNVRISSANDRDATGTGKMYHTVIADIMFKD